MEPKTLLLQMKYARIVKIFADRNNQSYIQALDLFYHSNTYQLVSQGIADLHCRSDEYLADELELELKATGNQSKTPEN